MANPVLYVVLNGELNMSAGKAAAQAVHAVTTMIENGSTSFRFRDKSYKRTVIVLEAQNSEQIGNLWEYLVEANVSSDYYIDEGHNEVAPYTITALAVEPIDSDNTELREIFSALPLYGNKKKRWFRR